MEETRKPEKKEKEEERGSTQRTRSAHSKFKKWFLASTAATLLAIAGPKCTSSTEDVYYPVPGDTQEQTDAGPDTDMDGGPDLDADTDTDADTDMDGGPDLDADTDTDADTDMDGGPDLDADTDADTDMDGGPDLDADTDADTDMDGGPDADTDADTDSGTDSGTDAGVVCSGTSTGAVYGYPLYTGYDVTVGGYTVFNNGAVPGGIEVDIDCSSSSAPIATSLFLPDGPAEVVYNVPADGLKIRLNNHSSSATVSNISISVEIL